MKRIYLFWLASCMLFLTPFHSNAATFEIIPIWTQTFIPDTEPHGTAWQVTDTYFELLDDGITKAGAHLSWWAGPVALGEPPVPAYTEGVYALKLVPGSGAHTADVFLTLRYEVSGWGSESWLEFTDTQSNQLDLYPSNLDVGLEAWYPDEWISENYSLVMATGETYIVHGFATQEHWSSIGHWSMLDIMVLGTIPIPSSLLLLGGGLLGLLGLKRRFCKT